ncbi:unnamed protein product [Closterium sp. NIES-64]|nr:unnamed protein product [Closterium sp. NIES-64]
MTALASARGTTALPPLSRLSMLPAIAEGRRVSAVLYAGRGRAGAGGEQLALPSPWSRWHRGARRVGTNRAELRAGIQGAAGTGRGASSTGGPAFCVVSRRVYRHHAMPVLSLNTSTPLNGAKCRPATPRSKVPRPICASAVVPGGLAASVPHRSPSFANRTDFALCDAAKPWPAPHVAAALFDAADRATAGEERHSIMHVTLRGCARNFRKLRRHAEEWQAPAEAVLCFPVAAGGGAAAGAAWPVLLHRAARGQPHQPHMRRGSWEWSMRRHAPGLHISALPAAVTHASSTAHTLRCPTAAALLSMPLCLPCFPCSLPALLSMLSACPLASLPAVPYSCAPVTLQCIPPTLPSRLPSHPPCPCPTLTVLFASSPHSIPHPPRHPLLPAAVTHRR